MKEIIVSTRTGTSLGGVLFSKNNSKWLVIAITGVHGNFYSNPFYYNIGDTLANNGIDFLYAPTRDAYGQIESKNQLTQKKEILGSWNEDFNRGDDDIEAYINFAQQKGYQHIILAGHSLGSNKVIHYLANNDDKRIDDFILLSPANLGHLTSVVSDPQKAVINQQLRTGLGQAMLPFDLLGWLPCTADTAYQWLYSDILDNVHDKKNADFSQVERISKHGALFIVTLDCFTKGNPVKFLKNINDHMASSEYNQLIFIEGTGHTYQEKEQELADKILEVVTNWQGQIEKN